MQELKDANPEVRDNAVKTLDRLRAKDHAQDIAAVLLDKGYDLDKLKAGMGK